MLIKRLGTLLIKCMQITVMSSVNRPEDVVYVYEEISNQVNSFGNLSGLEKNKLMASIVLKMREAILKSYIATGFPKVKK